MIELHVLLLGVLVGSQLFFTGLAVLNLRHGERAARENADWLADRIGVDDPDRLLAYNRAKESLGQVQTWTLLGALLLALYTGLVSWAVESLVATGLHPVLQGLCFFLGVFAGYWFLSAPFDYYDTFSIEERFGFNEQSRRLWVRDALLQLAIGGVLVGALIAGILGTIELLGTWWWVAGWLLVVGFGLAIQILYPRVIAPLFNDFDPIESGELREAVEDVFDRAGVECEALYSMDASRRSSHLNAYFVGFGAAKRVVLFDTLIEKLDRPEIQSVLAHEIAHWKRAHIWKGLAGTTVRMGIAFAILGYLVGTDAVYAMFGLPTETTYAGLFVSLLFVVPLLSLTAPLENRLSLRFEREADRFAVETIDDPEPMVGALAKLAGENLANPFPHPWYAAFHYAHPPIPERMRYVREQASAAGEQA